LSFGTPHRHFRQVGSTNTVARELAAAGAPHGTVVTAAEQTAGRGRQGRTWHAPPGAALLYSAIVRRGGDDGEPDQLLPLRAGVAVCEAIEALGAGPAQLKWPNDVWLERRKCAGILVEARPQDGWFVIGIGLNLHVPEAEMPVELRGRIGSVGGGVTAAAAMEAVNRRLGAALGLAGADVLEQVRARDALAGGQLTWEGGSGRAAGIDGAGRLLVVDERGGTIALNAGEVHLGGDALAG